MNPAPEKYSKEEQGRFRADLDRRDRENLKRGRDIEVDGGRIIVRSPDGNRWILGVSNAGATTWTALP